MAGRPSRLTDIEFVLQFAEALAEGMSNRQLMAEFNIRVNETVVKYKNDPRVTTKLRKLINQRVQEVTRRVDSEISRRLENPKEFTTDELLRVRKEYLGGGLREDAEKADEGVVNAAFEAAENPEFAAAFEALKNM